MELGYTESKGESVIYVNLRCGKIAQTSKEERDGFEADYTTKKDGTKTHFFAKKYSEIAGYITDLRWKVSTFPDGSTDSGAWEVRIETGKEIFNLSVKKTDRPFLRFESVLCGVNFNEPVKFIGYKFLEKGKDKKVLCLYQDGTEGAMQPVFAEKWISSMLRKKVIEKLPLSDEEKTHFAYNDKGERMSSMTYNEMDGTFSAGYPYITQCDDDKWNLDIWTRFLDSKVKEIVLPAIQEANARRAPLNVSSSASDDDADDDENEVGRDWEANPIENDEEIPF